MGCGCFYVCLQDGSAHTFYGNIQLLQFDGGPNRCTINKADAVHHQYWFIVVMGFSLPNQITQSVQMKALYYRNTQSKMFALGISV